MKPIEKHRGYGGDVRGAGRIPQQFVGEPAKDRIVDSVQQRSEAGEGPVGLGCARPQENGPVFGKSRNLGQQRRLTRSPPSYNREG